MNDMYVVDLCQDNTNYWYRN